MDEPFLNDVLQRARQRGGLGKDIGPQSFQGASGLEHPDPPQSAITSAISVVSFVCNDTSFGGNRSPALHSSKAQFGHFLQEEFTGPINPHPDSLERKAEEFSGFRLRAVFQGCQDKGTFEFVGQYVDRLFQRDEFLLAVCFLIWPMFS